MVPNPNTRDNWERKFRAITRSGWFRKRWYRWLSFLFANWALETKIRKTYHRPVAGIAEGRFLDLGCGLGCCAALYNRRTRNASVGMDFALPAMRFARKESRRLGIGSNYVAGDVYRLPFADSSFDSVYIGQVLEHLDDESKVVREAIRILKRGGKLIVSVPIGKACSGGEADHVNFYYTEDDCRKLLEGCPVSDIAFHPFHRHRYFFSARVGK
jgi:ubiquinone/menaquinone biosynthesis C-methylase UbiE